MANNTVEYKIKLTDFGSEATERLKQQLKGVGATVEEVKSKAEDLKTRLINFNQAVASIQNVASAVSQVSSAISGMTQYYAAQVEAETKLQTVMRNTMNASDGRLRTPANLAGYMQRVVHVAQPSGLPGLCAVSRHEQ